MSSPPPNQILTESPAAPAEPSNDPRAPKKCSQPIFFLINSLETGGTERQFVELASALKRGGSTPQLGCLQKKGAFLESGALEGFGDLPQFRLGGSVYGRRSMQSRWELSRLLRRSRTTVAQAFDFYANLMLIPAARLAGVPVVIGSQRQLGDLLTTAQFRAQMTMFRWCDRVVCNSSAAADRLEKAGLPAHKLVVIGNGLPPEMFERKAPALPQREGILRVGMIARMNAVYKNQGRFLRAAVRVAAKLSAVEFVLVGDGPLRADLERQATDLGLGSRVQFVGNRRDIPEILASLDVSVVPSTSESLSNVMLESMAAGVAVVATSVGGNCELGGDDRAILVAPDDDEALAAGLERLLSDEPLRKDTSRRARAYALQQFSMDHVRDRYCELYSEVQASKHPRQGTARTTLQSSSRGASRLRVAFVAPSLRYVGGQSVQADLLMRNWNEDPDLEPRLIPVDPRFPYGLGWIERVPLLRTIVREPLYVISLWRLLKDEDVAHIFSASYSSFLLAPLPAWLMARLHGKKTLINYHSGECRDHLRGSSIARQVLKRADRLVVPSGYLVEVLGEFGLPAETIPNVVDVSKFRFRARKPLRPHLVCTRGFHPYYCVDVVVRAFAEVQKTFPEARLDLVGGGPIEPEIRSLVSQLRLTGVEFKGVAPHSEIPKFYEDADIFINGSRLDNMPVSILEAFAAGMPVITTEPEGMRYLVEHERTGLLSPVGDASALARNVIRVLQDPELSDRLVSNARLELGRYSWSAAREQWLSVYQDIATGPRIVPTSEREAE